MALTTGGCQAVRAPLPQSWKPSSGFIVSEKCKERLVILKNKKIKINKRRKYSPQHQQAKCRNVERSTVEVGWREIALIRVTVIPRFLPFGLEPFYCDFFSKIHHCSRISYRVRKYSVRSREDQEDTSAEPLFNLVYQDCQDAENKKRVRQSTYNRHRS